MLTKQQLELMELKEAAQKGGTVLSMQNSWDAQSCFEAVLSTHFKQVEFINPHQVVFTHYFSDAEMYFHNSGLAPEEFLISPTFYCGNQD